MTSRERVLAALRKEPADRVPIFMWFHPGTVKRLADVLEIPPNLVDQALGNDVVQCWVGNNYAMEGIQHDQDGETHTDPWGITWVRDGYFNQIQHFPLAGLSASEALEYEFPHDAIPELVEQLSCLVDAGDAFVGADVSPCSFELYNRLRGMEDALLDLAANRELAAGLLERAGDFEVALAEAAIAARRLDWLWTGDDAGSQEGMLMSPRTWRELIKPQLARVVAVGQAHDLPVAFHSCGAIRPIIPDLIEIGIDVLNPLQGNAAGMDPVELKREFGEHLAFMGGVDTQGLLPHGTVDAVRCVTAGLIADMTADGGGFILAASHTVPPETPLTNIFAMYEVAGLDRETIFDRASDLRYQLAREE